MLSRTETATEKLTSPYHELNYNQKLGLNIKIRREQLRMSRDQLAQKLFSNRWTIGRWEAGNVAVTCEELERIALALSTSSERLMP